MCVIMVKPAGVSLPTREILKTATLINSDGFGVVTSSGFFKKTLKSTTFLDSLAQVKEEDAAILHFRYATVGKRLLKNCHPFYDDVTGTWFAHNGTITCVPLSGQTDSEFVFRKRLVPVLRSNDLLDCNFSRVLSTVCGITRAALMQEDRVLVHGKWFLFKGVLYSNNRALDALGYKPTVMNVMNVPRNVTYSRDIIASASLGIDRSLPSVDQLESCLSYLTHNGSREEKEYLVEAWKTSNKNKKYLHSLSIKV